MCYLLAGSAQRPKTAGRTSPILPVPFQLPGISFDFGLELLPTSYGCLSLGQEPLVQPSLQFRGECSGILWVLTEDSTEAGTGVSSG